MSACAVRIIKEPCKAQQVAIETRTVINAVPLITQGRSPQNVQLRKSRMWGDVAICPDHVREELKKALDVSLAS